MSDYSIILCGKCGKRLHTISDQKWSNEERLVVCMDCYNSSYVKKQENLSEVK